MRLVLRILGPLVLLLIAASLWFMQDEEQGNRPQPSPSPTRSLLSPTGHPSPAGDRSPAGGSDQLHSPSQQDRARVARLSRRFVNAYLADRPRRAWLRRLSGMATQTLARDLRTVAQGNVPGTTVRRVQLRGATPYAASTEVRTDAGVLVVEMAYSGTGWQVTRVRPQDEE